MTTFGGSRGRAAPVPVVFTRRQAVRRAGGHPVICRMRLLE
jgi:hypothetical protein